MTAALTLPHYEWRELWRPTEPSPDVMAHTGVVVTSRGVVVGDPARPDLVTVDAGRELRRSRVDGVTELHSLTLVEDDGDELLWIADNGSKSFAANGGLERRASAAGGRVVAVDLDGRERRSLARPPLAVYDEGEYAPTSVAVDETRLGGDGAIWVADGYGAGLVHRFDADGAYAGTIDGSDGAGRFDNPHGLLIDRRGGDAKLLVADRRASRIQVYDLAGRFERSFGEDGLEWPTHLAVFGPYLLVTDLTAGRVTVFDADDRVVAHLVEGRLTGPHGICADDEGRVYVTEWRLGGGYVYLVPDTLPEPVVVTGYDEAVQVLLDTRSFSNVNCIGIASFADAAPEVQRVLARGYERFPGMVELDPPEHTRYRTLVNVAFTPRRVAGYEPRIRELATELIDAFPEGGVEFMGAFAQPLPGAVIGEVLGLPAEDMPMLQDYSDAFKALEAGTLASMSIDEQCATADRFVRFQHYAADVVRQRAAAPGDDLISAMLAAGRALDEPLSQVEEISMVIHLVFAGQETTVMLLGSMMLLLMTHRGEWEKLCDRPELVGGAVEEALRCEPPVVYHQRRSVRHATVGGVEIPPGRDVQVHFAAANRDPRRFPEPLRFDVERPEARKHLGFGQGVHFCVGAPLARLEAKVAFEELTRRLPGLRLRTDVVPARDPHEMLQGLAELRLEW